MLFRPFVKFFFVQFQHGTWSNSSIPFSTIISTTVFPPRSYCSWSSIMSSIITGSQVHRNVSSVVAQRVLAHRGSEIYNKRCCSKFNNWIQCGSMFSGCLPVIHKLVNQNLEQQKDLLCSWSCVFCLFVCFYFDIANVCSYLSD